MKKVTALVLGIFLLGFTAKAAEETSLNGTLNFYDGSSYIFVERGIEFSVFPDGQFDFVYVGPNNGNVNVNINTPNASITFNSGQNYDMYVQYDDYGAVIQIEDVPIYYDHYGRIVRAGDVEIQYNSRRIVRVGGMRIFYNSYGAFDYCTGFISPFYRTYVYRPWHVFYVRPIYTSCIVYDFPYRRYYRPHRYAWSYHRQYYNRGRYGYSNARRDFYRPGSRIHYKNGRVARNRDYNPNRRNSAYTRGDRGNNNRIGANNRPSSRGIARKDNSRLDRTKNDRFNSNGSSRGIAKKDNNRFDGNRGTRPKNSGVKPNTRPSNRGIAKKDNGFRGNNRKGSLSSGSSNRGSKGTISRSKPRNNSARPMAKRSNRSNGSKMNRSGSQKRNNSSISRNRSSVKKSSPSRSKSSVGRKSSSSRSRGSAPKRGRGL